MVAVGLETTTWSCGTSSNGSQKSGSRAQSSSENLTTRHIRKSREPPVFDATPVPRLRAGRRERGPRCPAFARDSARRPTHAAVQPSPWHDAARARACAEAGVHGRGRIAWRFPATRLRTRADGSDLQQPIEEGAVAAQRYLHVLGGKGAAPLTDSSCERSLAKPSTYFPATSCTVGNAGAGYGPMFSTVYVLAHLSGGASEAST